MTLAERLAAARATLTAAGISSAEAANDAELLARRALRWDRARLIASLRDSVPPDLDPAYAALIARRATREPASQIIGVREFWGLDFEVTRDVLTPRPETELVVQAALDIYTHAYAHEPATHPPIIVDVGTGTGCIAIALATELQGARFIASDVSSKALAIARRNASRHGVADRIAFRHTAGVPENDVDIIVSNPPYVPAAAERSLPPEVRDYEPAVALFGGDDGLRFYRMLLESAGDLTDAGWLVVEVGYDQGDAVRELAASRFWPDADIHFWQPGRSYRDLQGIERVLTFQACHDTRVKEKTP
ncbi:MAG TPA: peptide chain release factor N(5)-glutamine methyltransferase [Vicinamibacterales bacterium]|nr:peptide chain release factor N(5)-glutamine methyltransferase [Vicinamibacterales bacterium]